MTRSSGRVTVGMPVFNNARTVQRAIASVRAQSLPDWHLVISDDGSDDGSVRLAETAAAEDDRITVVRQPRQLGFMNFRATLDQAATPYCAWLAADDYWDPDFLALTVQALDAAPPAVSALPQAAFIGPPERPIPNLGFLKGTATGRIRQYLEHPGGTRMYALMRTGAVQAAFPPRPFHGYDWYLMVRLLAQGPQLSLPQTLLYREETPWWRYATEHAAQHPSGFHGSFPVAAMSRQLVRDAAVPLGVLPALLRLNLRKHEEIIALTRPGTFQRRHWLYRTLGLPLARDPNRLAAIPEAIGQVAAVGPACPRAETPGIDVTAILTFRNAAPSLGAALDHLRRLGCRVIAVDHSSTDTSRALAEAHLGGAVQQVITDPWTGTFDLMRQLRLKRQLMAQANTGWILHADADEFLDPPPGQDLAAILARAEAEGQIAVACDERLFLPQFEDEEHEPQSFQDTMTSYVFMRERDPKQRLFRRDAPLDLWLRTGGHTVTRDPARLAPTRLTLRHYPGLSLDDLRAQYIARVFSPDDRARHWHGNRLASHAFDIVEPDPAVFQSDAPCTRLPFLNPRPARPVGAPLEAADLYLLSHPADAGVARRIAAHLPGLRTAILDHESLPNLLRAVPVLHVVTHPARLHGPGVQRSLERRRAIDWVRRIALARQWAVDREAPYLEVRSEDALAPDQWLDRLARLWQPPVLRGSAGFLAPDAPRVQIDPWENPVRSITGPLSADLGYR